MRKLTHTLIYAFFVIFIICQTKNVILIYINVKQIHANMHFDALSLVDNLGHLMSLPY